jgi:methionyl-tRNA formyltransferase
MSKNNLRIVYMGTPEFAVPSLEALIQNGYLVVAVVTAPDKPQGRGQKLVSSPVKDCALQHHLPVLQPTNLKSSAFVEELKKYEANLQIVVAFRMLPEVIWNMPALGTFNLHASLLPNYRGAAPINWAIINGEKETGVTTFFLTHEIDTGRIIFQEKEPIDQTDDVGSLYERLMKKGAALVLKTVRAIEAGGHPSLPQILTGQERHAPKIFKETCELRWDQTTESIHNFIRGLSPYPAAWTILQGKTYKIFRTNMQTASVNATTCGKLDTDHKTYLRIQTLDGWIYVVELQPEGKRKMKIEDFLRGNTLKTNEK